MTKKRSVFSNNLYKSIHLSSFRKIIFKLGTCLSLSLILEHSVWTCHEIKVVDSTEYFKKMKLTLKHGLLKVYVEHSSSIFK